MFSRVVRRDLAGGRVVSLHVAAFHGCLDNHLLRLACVFFALGSAAGIARAEQLAPGVTYTLYNVTGPNNVYVVAVDKLHSEYEFKVGWAQGKRNYAAREGTSTIAARYDQPPTEDVLSAVNGSYFDTATVPRLLGIGQTSGEMLDTPSFSSSYTYHTFMVGPARTPSVQTNFNHAQGTIRFVDGFTMPLTQYNFYMGGTLYPINGVSAFTPSFDASTRSNFSVSPSLAVEVVLGNVSYPMRSDKEVSGIITAINTPTTGNTAIPAGGMVLTAWGSTKTSMVAHAKVGDRLCVRVASACEEYNNADNALTGIGWIIHNGAAYPAGWTNLESGASPTYRNPRTVIAWNDNYWFQVVCDGRSSASVGMTFTEMANFLIGTLGAKEAVNYDGGGSSTMVVNGTIRNVPSDGNERLVANAIMLVKKQTTSSFPDSDVFTSTGRTNDWDDKFSYNNVVAFSPASSGGDGYVMKVVNPLGGAEATRRGDYSDTNYAVQADIYCEYRPADAADGYERYAIFAHDSGTAALGLTNYGKGNCYALAYDSNDGGVRAGKYVDGVFTDFTSANPVYLPSTAWRRFRIECQGQVVRYYVDNSPVAVATDTTFVRGYYGIGYQEFFATNSNMHGTRADNFSAYELGAVPAAASNPSPSNGAVHAALSPTLSWTAGAGATSHNVYFGTSSPGTLQGNQAGTTFAPGTLALGATYYWHVDEVNENGSMPGEVWSFTTQYYLGDFDNDGDIDQEDFGPFQTCYTGTGTPQTDPACARARMDDDGDVDLDDATVFLECASGPGHTPASSCLSGS
jgi:hypothetical protein